MLGNSLHICPPLSWDFMQVLGNFLLEAKLYTSQNVSRKQSWEQTTVRREGDIMGYRNGP